MGIDVRRAALLARCLRDSLAAPGPGPGAPDRFGPWSAASYLALAERSAAYARLNDTDLFVLGLLVVRADDRGEITFARQDLVTLYGIQPGDIDDRPLLRALDRLRRGGWVRTRSESGRTRYALVLPRRSRIRRESLGE